MGRTSELARLVDSLATQPYRPLRLIVVDQNEDERVVPILEQLPADAPWLRLRSEPGLSRARNIGLSRLEGDLVSFPDDDCWYGPELLAEVTAFFTEHPEYDGLSVRQLDEHGSPSTGRWARAAGPVDRFNVFTRAISSTIFLRRAVVERVGHFDEELGFGAGTEFGSGEETDFLLRALEAEALLWYEPSLRVLHPPRRQRHDLETVRSGRSHGMGLGRILRKHRYPWWYVLYQAAGAVAFAAVALARCRPLDARFQWNVARGRIAGWLAPHE